MRGHTKKRKCVSIIIIVLKSSLLSVVHSKTCMQALEFSLVPTFDEALVPAPIDTTTLSLGHESTQSLTF